MMHIEKDVIMAATQPGKAAVTDKSTKSTTPIITHTIRTPVHPTHTNPPTNSYFSSLS
jgi:hypothetical protein